MRAFSDLDCPEGMRCVGGECIDDYKVVYDPAIPETKSKTGSLVFVGTGGDLGNVEQTKKMFQTDRKDGGGLWKLIEDGHVYEYSPGNTKEYKDYELTPEEHARFDSVEGCTKEEIEAAKKLLSKSIRVEVEVENNSIEILSKMVETVWYEKKPEREISFYTQEAGLKLFDEMIRKEFSK